MAGDTTIRFGKATVKLEGFTDLFRKLNRLEGNVQSAAIDVFGRAVDDLLNETQQNVPVDEGHLRASGRRSKPRMSKKGVVTASVTYGGAKLARLSGENPLYALAVHEDPEHPGYKFLERPAVAMRARVMRELAARIRSKIDA